FNMLPFLSLFFRQLYRIHVNHQLPVAPNLLQQNFIAHKLNEKWVSDITYCWADEGWLYLAVVMDLYSRKIVGWAISERMTKQLVIDALQMAIWSRKPPKTSLLTQTEVANTARFPINSF
ncbi:TPA: DDE-type integrase/transposase/recombinase, partial [Legionella pneumophila]